jgi:hypothetical protein
MHLEKTDEKNTITSLSRITLIMYKLSDQTTLGAMSIGYGQQTGIFIEKYLKNIPPLICEYIISFGREVLQLPEKIIRVENALLVLIFRVLKWSEWRGRVFEK